MLGLIEACKSLKRLVGPPGFEPGTSCTPSKGEVSISFMCSLDCNSLDEFGVPASAPCRSLTRRSIHGLFTVVLIAAYRDGVSGQRKGRIQALLATRAVIPVAPYKFVLNAPA